MGTLNPDLLSKDVDAIINDAVALKDQHRKDTLMPELLLLALLRRPDTAAARMLEFSRKVAASIWSGWSGRFSWRLRAAGIRAGIWILSLLAIAQCRFPGRRSSCWMMPSV
jgi:hypothetical protein